MSSIARSRCPCRAATLQPARPVNGGAKPGQVSDSKFGREAEGVARRESQSDVAASDVYHGEHLHSRPRSRFRLRRVYRPSSPTEAQCADLKSALACLQTSDALLHTTWLV
jgi:hypothetical protein